MMRPQALLEAVSANLREFIQPIGENLNKPQKKFLRDGPAMKELALKPLSLSISGKYF